MSKKISITTSWDDGHPLDLRLTKLLKKYNLAATFYIPLNNREGPVINEKEIKSLAQSFEIGGHSISHTDLTTIPLEEAKKEITVSKTRLEEIIEKPVNMFCFPRGKFNKNLIDIVKKASFSGIRTVDMFNMSFPKDKILLRPTLQIYDYRRQIYIKQAIKKKKIKIFYFCLTKKPFTWSVLAKFLFDGILTEGGLLHLWGHSWEIEKLNLWNDLENIFKYISRRNNIDYIDNSTAMSALSSQYRA